MDRFSFNGRPDGIGNRMEEIIQLEAICSKLDVTCEYVWRNAYEHRSYEICCEAKRVEIVSVPTPALPVRQFSDFSFTHTQEEILECAKMIKPRFEQVFPEGVKPVGVHVRGTDRINRNGLVNHPLNMRDVEELKAYIVRTLHEINEIKPEHVFICADSEDSKEVFLEHLDPSITVVEPRNSGGVSLEYSDFFAHFQMQQDLDGFAVFIFRDNCIYDSWLFIS